MTTTRDRTRKPAWWLPSTEPGKIVIQVGAEGQQALDAARFDRTAVWYAQHGVEARGKRRGSCLFCDGAITRGFGGLPDCSECQNPSGTPIDKALARVIIPILLACQSLAIDTIEQADGFWHLAFTVTREADEDLTTSIDISEQWEQWKRHAGVL